MKAVQAITPPPSPEPPPSIIMNHNINIKFSFDAGGGGSDIELKLLKDFRWAEVGVKDFNSLPCNIDIIVVPI